MARNISPPQFAEAIRMAQLFRSDGCSTIESARRGCIAANVDVEWHIPLLGFINDSPTVAEAWAQQATEAALDRVTANLGLSS